LSTDRGAGPRKPFGPPSVRGVQFTRLGPLLSGWPRRLLVVLCLVIAGVSALRPTTSGSPDGSGSGSSRQTVVVIATHDLAAGAVVTAADVHTAQWPASLRPATALSALTDAVGRRVAGRLGAGELFTSTRLAGSELTAGLTAGLIAVPVPLVDAAAASLIRAGDRVDLLSPPGLTNQQAQIVASALLVLAVLPNDSGSANGGAQLVVAADSAAELRIAQAIATPMLATVTKPP
jgi:pilus assembly protein CpaB